MAAPSNAAARRYAEAYFSLAAQQDDVASWRRELAAAADTLTDPEIAGAMSNPKVRTDERTHLILDLLDGASPAVRNLSRLLVERKRTPLAPQILQEFDRLADREAGVVRAQVTTAVPVTPELERQLSGTLSATIGGDVRTVVVQDPEIIGGLVVRIGDRVIDGSVRTRLQQLQASLA